MDQAYSVLRDALDAAARSMEERYFRVATQGADRAAVRERAYCYELYHRLRCALPGADECPYVLHGEIDKRGHAVLANCVGNANPDFIVHVPGAGGRTANLAVIEVKAASADGGEFLGDAQSLIRFLECADYHRAIQLVFGGSPEMAARRVQEAYAWIDDGRWGERIEAYWHSAPNEPLEQISWF